MMQEISEPCGLDQPTLVRLLVSERVKMLAYIQSLVLDEDLAEDVFQDVCMVAVQKMSAIKSETHLMRWLRTTARFIALNAMQKRKQKSISLDTGLVEVLEAAWLRKDQEDASDLTESLRRCVELLPETPRQLIEKRYMHGEDYEQLSKETNRPVASLYVTFSRILTSLNDCISARMRRIHAGTDGGANG